MEYYEAVSYIMFFDEEKKAIANGKSGMVDLAGITL